MSLPAKAADPEEPDADWTFVYCDTCGRSLGTTAGSGPPAWSDALLATLTRRRAV